MSDDLQQAVDELALRLGRSVLLEDHLQRVIAYSEQTEPMDDVRRALLVVQRPTGLVVPASIETADDASPRAHRRRAPPAV